MGVVAGVTTSLEVGDGVRAWGLAGTGYGVLLWAAARFGYLPVPEPD